MKNIETILKEAGIDNEETINKIVEAVNGNYKTVAEVQKIQKKLDTAETEKADLNSQLEEANKTIDGFKELDIEGIKKQVEDYKAAAETAKTEAKKELMKRDMTDFLDEKLGEAGYNVKSKRIRDSIKAEILDGKLKWDEEKKTFYGFDDYMKTEKEADPTIYETADEKQAREQRQASEEKAPKFTEPMTPASKEKKKVVPLVW